MKDRGTASLDFPLLSMFLSCVCGNPAQMSADSLGVPGRNPTADQAVCKWAGLPSLPSECDVCNWVLQSTSEKTCHTTTKYVLFCF